MPLHWLATGRSFIDKCVQLDERMAEVDKIELLLGDVHVALSALESAFPSRSVDGVMRRERGVHGHDRR